jgi:hypothetical protein
MEYIADLIIEGIFEIIKWIIKIFFKIIFKLYSLFGRSKYKSNKAISE